MLMSTRRGFVLKEITHEDDLLCEIKELEFDCNMSSSCFLDEDVVLMLDVTGSMYGYSIEEQDIIFECDLRDEEEEQEEEEGNGEQGEGKEEDVEKGKQRGKIIQEFTHVSVCPAHHEVVILRRQTFPYSASFILWMRYTGNELTLLCEQQVEEEDESTVSAIKNVFWHPRKVGRYSVLYLVKHENGAPVRSFVYEDKHGIIIPFLEGIEDETLEQQTSYFNFGVGENEAIWMLWDKGNVSRIEIEEGDFTPAKEEEEEEEEEEKKSK